MFVQNKEAKEAPPHPFIVSSRLGAMVVTPAQAVQTLKSQPRECIK